MPSPSSSRRAFLTAASGSLAALTTLAGCADLRGAVPGLDAPPAPPQRRVAPDDPPPGAWPRRTYDASNSRYNPHASPPTSDPTEVWRVETDGVPSVVAGPDAVYVADGAVVAAVDRRTGDERWRVRVDDDDPTLTYAAGRVYAAGTGVRAFDAESGARVWTAVPEDGVYEAFERGGVVYGTRRESLLALHADTGERLWERDVRFPSLAARDGRLYVSSAAELRQYRLDGPPLSGLPDPEYAYALPDSEGHYDPTITDERAIAGEYAGASGSGTLSGVDLGSETRWHRRFATAVNAPAVAGTRGYFTSYPARASERGGSIYGVGLRSGAPIWEYEAGHTLSDAVLAGGLVFAGGVAAGVPTVCVSSSSGGDGSDDADETSATPSETPTCTGGEPGAASGSVYAVEAATGELRYELSVAGFENRPTYPVTPVGELLLVADSDGLHAFAEA